MLTLSENEIDKKRNTVNTEESDELFKSFQPPSNSLQNTNK